MVDYSQIDWENVSRPENDKEWNLWRRHDGVGAIRCESSGKVEVVEDINPERISSIHIDRIPPRYRCVLHSKSKKGKPAAVEEFISEMQIEGSDRATIYEPMARGMNVGIQFTKSKGSFVCAVDKDLGVLLCKPTKSRRK
jgi:hypothetical protein